MILIGSASRWEFVFYGLGLSAVTFVVGIIGVGLIFIYLPATFFLDSHCRDLWIDHHPWIRWAGLVLKNCLAVGILGIGIILCFLPGQGILMILIGLALLDMPGKRRLERALLRKQGILTPINRLRRRFGKPPLVVEEPNAE